MKVFDEFNLNRNVNNNDNDNFDENVYLNMLLIFFLIKLCDVDKRVEIIIEFDIFDEINNISFFSFLRRQRKSFEKKVLKKINMSKIDEKMMSKMINFVKNNFVHSS